MAGRVTIQDIADALGVSRNTVSKAINNTGILADATREKILQKAVEMGYKQFSYVSFSPSSEEDSTPIQATVPVLENTESVQANIPQGGTVAMFTTIFLGNSHFSSTMLDKVQAELTKLGYSLTMHRVSSDNIQNKTLPLSFNKEITSAVICFELFDPDYAEMVCNLDIPALFVDCPANIASGSLKADRLLMDNRSNIYTLINDMVSRGKSKIGFIGEQFHCMSFFERYMAVREALSLLDLPFEKKYSILGTGIMPFHPDSVSYQNHLEEAIRNMEELPDVFICANDFVAIDALQVFRKLNIRVPEDVYLCGFDDSPESRVITPPLTTIHIHSQVMGFSAVHLLISRIKNPNLNYRTIYTETSLIYRESTEN